MSSFKLIKPDISYKEDIISYKNEFLEANSSMDGCGPLRRLETIEEWLRFNKLVEEKDSVIDDWVRSSQYVYVREFDNKILGMIQIRYYFNEFLEKYGGHIGYSIRPTERRKTYATSMLRECLKLCKEAGLIKVLITCDQDNIGSKKTILKNGGVFESRIFEPTENIYLERYWIDL